MASEGSCSNKPLAINDLLLSLFTYFVILLTKQEEIKSMYIAFQRGVQILIRGKKKQQDQRNLTAQKNMGPAESIFYLC